MAYDTDVLIVGGGLNGATMALALAQAGLDSIVLDTQPVGAKALRAFDGRSYALALASVRMLGAFGLWETLEKNAQPILEIKASDGRAGEGAAPFFLHFDHAELEEGPMGHMVEDRHLRRALLDAMKAEARITHKTSTTVVAQAVADGAATVTLQNGKTLRGRLLIGADGRQGETATRAGIKRTGWPYHQTALVCAITHELPHNGIAHQFFMPPGPLAILPLPGNRSSIVWSESTDRAAEISAMDEAAYLDVLRPRFGDFLGEIGLDGARYSYPLSLSLAQSFVKDRLALVGDAAHGIHPIAGQGLNLGFKDVGALAETLRDAKRRGEDFASLQVLERYQRWRRFDTAAMALATDGVNKLFSNDNSALRMLRDIGMGMVSATPALRRGFMRQAAGLTGEVPQLLQGQRLS